MQPIWREHNSRVANGRAALLYLPASRCSFARRLLRTLSSFSLRRQWFSWFAAIHNTCSNPIGSARLPTLLLCQLILLWGFFKQNCFTLMKRFSSYRSCIIYFPCWSFPSHCKFGCGHFFSRPSLFYWSMSLFLLNARSCSPLTFHYHLLQMFSNAKSKLFQPDS